MEAELVAARSGGNGRVAVKPALLLAVTCLLALVPPALVFLDRWLLNRRVLDFFRPGGAGSEVLCQSAYPSYFLLIFPILLLCVPLVWLLIRRLPEGWLIRPLEHRPPTSSAAGRARHRSGSSRVLFVAAGFGIVLIGDARRRETSASRDGNWALAYAVYLLAWFLREMPAAGIADAARRWLGPLAAILLAQIALLLVLASRYGQYRFQWITAVLLLLAATNLWRYRKAIPPIVWIATFALVLYGVNMNAWWLSAIGDEYSFWAYAREIAEKQRLSFIGAKSVQRPSRLRRASVPLFIDPGALHEVVRQRWLRLAGQQCLPERCRRALLLSLLQDFRDPPHRADGRAVPGDIALHHVIRQDRIQQPPGVVRRNPGAGGRRLGCEHPATPRLRPARRRYGLLLLCLSGGTLCPAIASALAAVLHSAGFTRLPRPVGSNGDLNLHPRHPLADPARLLAGQDRRHGLLQPGNHPYGERRR